MHSFYFFKMIIVTKMKVILPIDHIVTIFLQRTPEYASSEKPVTFYTFLHRHVQMHAHLNTYAFIYHAFILVFLTIQLFLPSSQSRGTVSQSSAYRMIASKHCHREVGWIKAW